MFPCPAKRIYIRAIYAANLEDPLLNSAGHVSSLKKALNKLALDAARALWRAVRCSLEENRSGTKIEELRAPISCISWTVEGQAQPRANGRGRVAFGLTRAAIRFHPQFGEEAQG